MRWHFMTAGLVLGFLLAGNASAQRAFTWGPVGPVQYQVVDTQNMNVPIAQPQSAANRTGFKLPSYFPSFHPFSNKPVFGSSPFPTPAQLPGSNYLKNFNFHRGVPIQP